MILLLFFALLPPPVCHDIHADWIYGRDLAAAAPEFSQLPPDLPLGLSPVPGQSRVFHASELRHIAAANKLSAAPSGDVCFAWPVRVLSREKLAAAMKTSLGARTSTIELVDQSLIPAPDGAIVFPLSGLSGTSDRPVVWRGYVQYAEQRRFSIWARVRLVVEEEHVTTIAELAPGEPIRPDQVQLQRYSGSLNSRLFLSDPAKAIGAVPRRSIPAGTGLTEDMIEPALDVERGSLVSVIVQNGAAHLEAQGIAEQSGRCGDIISVKNPKSARPFRARITKAGTVMVVPGGPVELVAEERPL